MAAPGWEPQAFDVRGQLIPTKPGGMEQDYKLCWGSEGALGA